MSLPDPILLNAPLTALTRTAGATGSLADALPAAGLRLMADPADMPLQWSSPRDRLLQIDSTGTTAGRWLALRLTLDLPDLDGLAGLGLWLRGAADPALTLQAVLRSGSGSGAVDAHIDTPFERQILLHASESDHHALLLPDRLPDLPTRAPWRELLLFMPPYRPVTLALHALRVFTVPA